MPRIHGPLFSIRHFLFIILLLCSNSPLSAGDPHSAYYSPDTDKLLWFIHASDIHMGNSGSNDSTNLQWLTGQARNVINPSFIVVTGDLTDSTDGNILGYPDGPHQKEWNEYKDILSSNGVDASFYFDIPGNHDAYNDQDFSYYLANSIQGRATGRRQASWIRTGPWGKYHFLGINTADNSGDPFSIFWPYGDRAGLDSSELSFISGEMTANPDANLTLVFGHHPIVETGDNDTYLFYGKDAFVGFMDRYGATLYGYGHTHDSSEKFFTQNMTEGVFYFNVADLGKGSPNQYTITAIDCNGISSITQTVSTWPVVLITAPMDRRLGGIVNPYAYTVTNGASNPIRALVFDPAAVAQVQFRVNGGGWQPMESVSGNPRLWQGAWDASALVEGEYTLEVQATTGSGVRSDSVTTYVKFPLPPVIGVCGSSNGGVFATPPSSNLCSFGTLSTTGSWNWRCVGQNGGTTAYCTATYGYLLSVIMAGSGAGSVHSNSNVSGVPGDIYCPSVSCSAGYPYGSIVNLSDSPDNTSTFTGWSGACTGTPCNVTMDEAKSVTATFTAAPRARNATTGASYATLADAITAASSGNEIWTLGTQLDGAVLLDKTITLLGGWNATYTGKSGLPTLLNGELTNENGNSSTETIDVKGKLTIKSGCLLVNGVVLR
jgi:uncharacterized repeat protein (TIGR02543 family)